MKETIKKCDISNREHDGLIETRRLDVIFDHDQEDGKSKVMPYLSTEEIELCQSCKKFMLENRKYIYAYGAMGYNTYSL